MTNVGRVAVLGLDGVPFSLLSKLFEQGVMPRLEALAREGIFVPLTSVLPAVSSAAWTSFMTAADPGLHGIFGFTDLEPGRIAVRLPSFDDLKVPALWHRIPGKRSVVVNLPFTYPARPLEGVLIAGFVAPVFERAVYPSSLIPWLTSKNYRTDVDCVRARYDRGFFIQDLFDTLSIWEEVMLALWDREPWDLFIGVITGTDRLHHFLFDAFEDPTHVFHREFTDYYRRVDACIARFLDRLGSTRIILLSDHGFTKLKHTIYLNHLLRRLGYVRFSRLHVRSFEDISLKSLAFALDPTRIYLNTKERFRDGLLTDRQATEILTKLKSDLERLRLTDIGLEKELDESDTTDTLFAAVLLGRDIYGQSCYEHAPDLVVVPRKGYDVKATVSGETITSRDIFTGMHTHEDAFVIVNDPSLADRFRTPTIPEIGALVWESMIG